MAMDQSTVSRAQKTTFAFFGDRAVRLTVNLALPALWNRSWVAMPVGVDRCGAVVVCDAYDFNILTVS